jgi:tetratricopeptide (TPR) repeat protein
MKFPLLVLAAFVISLVFGDFSRAESPTTDSSGLSEAKKMGWDSAMEVIKALDAGDQKEFPGIRAWLKDFHKQTKGIDFKATPQKGQPIDADALLVHNPNFWRAFYEIAPGDPALTILHAGLLLTGGEASRASYVIEMSRYGPAIAQDQDFKAIYDHLQAVTQLAGKQSNALTQEGVKLFDEGDYAGAIQKYKKALALWPQNGWAHYELGYTIRTKLEVAAGEKPDLNVTVRINEKPFPSPESDRAFRKSRQHDPLQIMAYQGTDQKVIQGFLALVKTIQPGMEKLQTEQDPAAVDEILVQLADGFQEANIHELALVVRQMVVARRGRYVPADHPFISKSLRKLAPGPTTEETLKRLLSGGYLKFRQLMRPSGPRGMTEPFLNLFDGKTYIPGNVIIANPSPSAQKDEGPKKVKIEYVRLLTNEDDLAARSKIEDVANFIKRAEGIAQKTLEKSDKPGKVLMQFKCSPSGFEVQLARHGKVEESLLQELYGKLTKMEKFPVKEGTVEFQMPVTITP